MKRAALLCALSMLCGSTAHAERGPDAAFVFDPPVPIVEPVRIEATGGVSTRMFMGANGDVASINVRGVTRQCYQVHVVDASGQETTFFRRGDCGRTVWMPFAGR